MLLATTLGDVKTGADDAGDELVVIAAGAGDAGLEMGLIVHASSSNPVEVAGAVGFFSSTVGGVKTTGGGVGALGGVGVRVT